MDSIAELISRSTVGDKAALAELFEHGERAIAEDRIAAAAATFREAAVSYRIDASRQRAHREQAEADCEQLQRDVALLVRVLARKPSLPTLTRKSNTVDREAVREIVVDELFYERQHDEVFWFLERRLTELGTHFTSPGGSIQRKLTVLLWSVYADTEPTPTEQGWCEDVLVRAGLCLLIDAFEERLQLRPT